jgi:membrane-bound lytic murein transglycosylase D
MLLSIRKYDLAKRLALIALAIGLGALVPVRLSRSLDISDTPYRKRVLDFEDTSIQAFHAPTVRALDKEALSLISITPPSPEKQECTPQRISQTETLAVHYLVCSNLSLVTEGEPVRVSKDFTVSASLARRYHFWRRVYSLWTKNHYVLHIAEWPEVVLEAYETKTTTDGKTGKDASSREIIEKRRQAYALLLEEMQRRRDNSKDFTPAMTRIARAMEHISDLHKYQTAAASLRLQRGQREFVEQGLEVAPRYLPWIEKEFVALGVPFELAKLAFIESSFNLKALSRVGASGVYQIMPETGKQYLRIERGIDERNDPIKAGRAAARILKFYYSTLGSWPLAITAYNHGVGGIRKAVEAVGSSSLEDLIARYDGPSFGFASKNFYTEFLGITATINNKNAYFPRLKPMNPLRFRTIKLRIGMPISEMKRAYSVTSTEILRLNPDLAPSFIKLNGILPKNYVLKIPVDTNSRVAAAESDET